MDTSDWDKEVINLCLALNTVPGVSTTSSCSGHEKDPMRIWLQVESIKALNLFGWAGCFRYWSWRGSWELQIDAGDINKHDDHLALLLQSTDKGPPAYTGAEKLARGITRFVDSENCV